MFQKLLKKKIYYRNCTNKKKVSLNGGFLIDLTNFVKHSSEELLV